MRPPASIAPPPRGAQGRVDLSQCVGCRCNGQAHPALLAPGPEPWVPPGRCLPGWLAGPHHPLHATIAAQLRQHPPPALLVAGLAGCQQPWPRLPPCLPCHDSPSHTPTGLLTCPRCLLPPHCRPSPRLRPRAAAAPRRLPRCASSACGSPSAPHHLPRANGNVPSLTAKHHCCPPQGIPWRPPLHASSIIDPCLGLSTPSADTPRVPACAGHRPGFRGWWWPGSGSCKRPCSGCRHRQAPCCCTSSTLAAEVPAGTWCSRCRLAPRPTPHTPGQTRMLAQLRPHLSACHPSHTPPPCLSTLRPQ